MRRVLIEAPTDDVVTVEEAQQQLRILGEADLVEAVRDAAVAQFDPAAGGWLGRALRPQTWELRLDEFPCRGVIELPLPPLLELISLVYIDSDGAEQSIDVDAGLRMFDGGGTTKAVLAPLYGQQWPRTRCEPDAVRVQFSAGYELLDPDPLPSPIKQAVHIGIRELWSIGERSLLESARQIEGVERKEWVVSSAASQLIQSVTERLLSPYRVLE